MRLPLYVHLDAESSARTIEAGLANLASLDVVDLFLTGEPSRVEAIAGALTCPYQSLPTPGFSSLLSPPILASIAERNAPALVINSDVKLTVQALEYVIAVTAKDLGAAAASLFAPSFAAPNRPPFLPLDDGCDGIFAAIDPGPAIAVTPAQAADLLARGLDGRACIFPRRSLAWTDDPRFDPAIERGHRDWIFLAMENSLARYDHRLEILPDVLRHMVPGLAAFDFSVDLFGGGEVGDAPYLLSSRPCHAPLRTFGLERTPLEANILFGVPGDMFSLAEPAAFGVMTASRRERLLGHVHRSFDLNQYLRHFLDKARKRASPAS